MKKIITSCLLCILFLGPLVLSAQDLMVNGGFQNKFAGWTNSATAPGVAVFSIDSAAPYAGKYDMQVVVTTVGTNPWDIQSIHSGYTAILGRDYIISLYAKADADGKTLRVVNQNVNYAGTEFALTTAWKKYNWKVSGTEVNPMVRFNFPVVGTFNIDSVTINIVPTYDPTPIADSLKVLAKGCGLNIGTAVDLNALKAEKFYQAALKQHFNMVTAENAMKMDAIKQSATGAYNFAGGDTLVKFAMQNNMKVRGHALIWHAQIPQWVRDSAWTKTTLFNYVHTYIDTVVKHFKGKVVEWDVVNEAIADDNNNALRPSLYYDLLGVDIYDSAFKWAHAADPSALLFYNDYNIETMDAKSGAAFALVSGLVDRGAPINGVGLQSHRSYNESESNFTDLDRQIKRIGALGLKVSITELDVAVPVPAVEANYPTQAHTYAQWLRVALKNKDIVNSFVFWGFTDKHSWIPQVFPEKGYALPLDTIYNKKPAFDSVAAVLRTSCIVTSVADGSEMNSANTVFSYPNPFVKTTNLYFPGQFTYSVYDVTGIQVAQGQSKDVVELGEAFRSGLYTVRMYGSNSTKTIKIVKSE